MLFKSLKKYINTVYNYQSRLFQELFKNRNEILINIRKEIQP